MSQKIFVGEVVLTVGPTGKPNAHTQRIGRGRVVSFHQETDNGVMQDFAFVKFFSGLSGSWPVDRLAVVNQKKVTI